MHRLKRPPDHPSGGRRRRRLVLCTWATAAAVGGLGLISSAATAAVPASVCQGTGVINASQLLGSVTDLTSCPIVGRQIELTLSDGTTGGGVAVPSVGRTVGNETQTTAGDYELVATNSNGLLSVTETPPTMTAGSPTPAAADPACSQSTYNLEGPHWKQILSWYYNGATVPPGDDAATALSDIRAGNTNMSTGVNNCGLPINQFSSQGAYQGATAKYANINANGDCTSSFPDFQNTVSWQTFNSSTLLGDTCWLGNADKTMVESDIALAQNPGRLVTNLTASCSNSYDLESTTTHEWGHAYGLAHTANTGNQVMRPYQDPCTARRHLGAGDYAGMKALYGS